MNCSLNFHSPQPALNSWTGYHVVSLCRVCRAPVHRTWWGRWRAGLGRTSQDPQELLGLLGLDTRSSAPGSEGK